MWQNDTASSLFKYMCSGSWYSREELYNDCPKDKDVKEFSILFYFLSNLAYDLVILIEKLNGNLILSRFGEISEIVDPGEFTHRTLFWRQLHVTKPWPGIEAQCNYIGVSEILAIYSEILASLSGINFLKNRIFLGSGQNWINWIWSRQFLILLKWFFLSMVWLPQGERTIDS